MKKIFYFLTLFTAMSAVAQNQTFTGVKTFNRPPKFKAVPNNNANTKILAINSQTNLLEYVEKDNISPTITVNGIAPNSNGNIALPTSGEGVFVEKEKREQVIKGALHIDDVNPLDENGYPVGASNISNKGRAFSVLTTKSIGMDIALDRNGGEYGEALRLSAAPFQGKCLFASNNSGNCIEAESSYGTPFVARILVPNSTFNSKSGPRMSSGYIARFTTAGEDAYDGYDGEEQVGIKANGTVELNEIKLRSLNIAPATSTSAGEVGQIKIDANYIYVCIAKDVWKRASLINY